MHVLCVSISYPTSVTFRVSGIYFSNSRPSNTTNHTISSYHSNHDLVRAWLSIYVYEHGEQQKKGVQEEMAQGGCEESSLMKATFEITYLFADMRMIFLWLGRMGAVWEYYVLNMYVRLSFAALKVMKYTSENAYLDKCVVSFLQWDRSHWVCWTFSARDVGKLPGLRRYCMDSTYIGTSHRYIVQDYVKLKEKYAGWVIMNFFGYYVNSQCAYKFVLVARL